MPRPSRRPRTAASVPRVAEGGRSLADRPLGRATAAAALVVVLFAGVAAACGDDSADPPATTSTTAGTTVVATDPPPSSGTSSTTTTVASEEAEVRAVIDRYWDAYLEAVGVPDPDNEALQQVLTGEAKARITTGIAGLRDDGLRVVAPQGSVFSHHVMSVDLRPDGTAVVQECVVDDLQKVTIDSGAIVDGAVVTSRYESGLRKSPDGWRIAISERADRREGVQDCAVFASA